MPVPTENAIGRRLWRVSGARDTATPRR
jgi:hypothetical protein